MIRLRHTQGMTDFEKPQARVRGAGALDPATRAENARKAAAARWGGVMSPEEAKKRRAENTRNWRARKKK